MRQAPSHRTNKQSEATASLHTEKAIPHGMAFLFVAFSGLAGLVAPAFLGQPISRFILCSGMKPVSRLFSNNDRQRDFHIVCRSAALD